jgi:5-methylcytosine-specific restriction endonuclease McrA
MCGFRIIGTCEYDHIKPDGLGGEPTLENCAVLCGKCHRHKTHEEDRPIMAKADRQKKAAAGVKRKWKWPKRSFQK